MKYLLVGKKIGNYTNGSYVVYKKFSERYESVLSFNTDFHFDKLDLTIYDKIVFCCHSTNLYNGLLYKLLTSLKNKHVLFTRKFNNIFCNSATNGFSVYKNYANFKNFIPIVSLPTNLQEINKETYSNLLNLDYPTFGFYNRSMTHSATVEILNRISSSTNKSFNIITCGSYIDTFAKLNIKHYHTQDSNVFFNLIQNYIHIQTDYIDPVPNMLLEAFYHNKNIISYALNDRTHTDGCDDILGLFNYYKNLDFSFYTPLDNNENLQLVNKLDVYYKNLFGNNFNYYLDRHKFKSFKDWLISL